MVNVNEIKAYMAREGVTQKELAKALNISERTLSRKFNNGVFGSDEMELMITRLKIKKPAEIFFAKK